MDYESDFLLGADPLELSDVLEFLEGKNVVQQKQMIKYNRCRLITKKILEMPPIISCYVKVDSLNCIYDDFIILHPIWKIYIIHPAPHIRK